MHESFRSCASSSSKVVLGFLLMCVPLLLAQNATVKAEPNKDLPDAPMPVTLPSPTSSNPSFTHRSLPPSLDLSRTQVGSWPGTSSGIEHPTFETNAPGSGKSRPDGRNTKVAGKALVNRFSFDPIGGHANRAAPHEATQWYTNHIPIAGSIMRQGLKISKAHPHLTTVIKILKPRP
jgi:hypothetical protein